MIVVARYSWLDNKWYLAHANSYQNAYGSGINGFEKRTDAILFAAEKGCLFEFHNYDPLQFQSWDDCFKEESTKLNFAAYWKDRLK